MTVTADIPAEFSDPWIGPMSTLLGQLKDHANVYQMPRGPRFAAIGDSIIGASVGSSQTLFGSSIQSHVSWKSDGRLALVRQAGVPNDTLAMMLARFDADITPWKPDVVLVRGGINDIATGVPLATSQANVVALASKVLAIGAVPVFDTVSPSDGSDAAEVAKIVAFNSWLVDWAHQMGFRCANSWALAVAGSFFGWPDSSYTIDGLHPSPKGSRLVGDAILGAVHDLPIWPWKGPELEDNSLLANGLFLTDTAGRGDDWNVSGSNTATSPAFSMQTEEGIAGRLQRITLPNQAGAGRTRLESDIAVSPGVQYQAGDIVRVSALARVTGTGMSAHVGFSSWNGSNYQIQGAVSPEDGLVRVTFEYRARTAGGNDGNWRMEIDAVAEGAGASGYAEFGEVEVVNLTRRGLAPTYPFTP